MWQLQNLTPYVADHGFTHDLRGAEVARIAIKGTYILHPDGTTSLAEEQEPLRVTPQYLGAPGISSLKYEADLVSHKPGTDVVILGNAHAPRGVHATSVDVAVCLGHWKKVLRVWGDRYWKRGLFSLGLTAPEPFRQMPLIYERAYGGVDPCLAEEWETRNPVGLGFSTGPEHLVGRRAANIEYLEEPLTCWHQRPRPAGLGPIAPDWSPRLELAAAFDDHFSLHAPEDQQFVPHLRGGEVLELHNLSSQGRQRIVLPHLYLALDSFFGSKAEEHRPALYTVIVEPERSRLQMVWQARLPLLHGEHLLERTEIREKRHG